MGEEKIQPDLFENVESQPEQESGQQPIEENQNSMEEEEIIKYGG